MNLQGRWGRLAAALVVLGGLLGAVVQSAKADDKAYILTTATTGGTYYPVGVAIATLTKLKLQPTYGFSISAISSAGSGENIKLMRDDEAQFAIVQGLYGAWARAGEGPLAHDGPQEHLRAVTMLWENVEHFVLRNDVMTSGTFADLSGLAGRKFSIGSRNSGAEGSSLLVLEALGVDPKVSMSLVNLDYGSGADAMQNGTIVGMTTPAGPPVSAVARVFAAMGGMVSLLEITDTELDKLNARYPLWSRHVIPAGTYPGLSKEVRTAAQPNFLAVRADVPDEVVYELTRAIYENLSFLNSVHKATKAMVLEKSVQGLPVPLHPGALRYYREAGIEVPVHLIPGDLIPDQQLAE